MLNEIPPIVRIPAVSREAQIGNVFNHVFSVMFQTEQTDLSHGRKVLWDFSDCNFLHPFYLAALSVLKTRYNDSIICIGIRPIIQSYLDVVHFATPLEVSENGEDKSLWHYYSNKTYLPICVFNPQNRSSVVAQELVQTTVRAQLSGNQAVFSILSLLLGELIDNITDHSCSKNGFLFCQLLPREGNLYVYIGDTGHSIYSSYATDERYENLVTSAESSALALALKGKSTKNRPENENRGYGISKSRSLIVNGLKGEFFIISGSAFFRHDPAGELLVDLPEPLRWDGTVVLLKIPTVIPPNFNLYDYIS